MNRLGLRARVALGSIAILALGVTIIGVATNVLLTKRLDADANAVLRARADAQLGTVGLKGGRVVVLDGPEDEALDREAWVFAGGKTVARPTAPAAVDRAAAALAGVREPATRDVRGELRLRAEPAFAGDRRTQIATVVVAVRLEPYEQSERISRLGTALLGIFVVLAGGFVAWRAVAAGLRPMARMAHDATSYGEHDLTRRFDLGPPRDELTTLAATLDGLLERIEASLRHEQRLTAEIAHELRTPLSGMRAVAELGMRPSQSADSRRESLATVVGEADRASAAIDTLLRAGRHVGPDTATCALEKAVTAAVDANAAAARERGIAIELEGRLPSVRIGAETAFVAQLLNPLVENAIRHATTTVRLSAVDPGEHAVRVCVHDDGPGIPKEDSVEIFDPGWQTPGGSGAGLGLALARRLARSLGGEVYARHMRPGAELVVELPVVTRTAPS